MLLTEKERKRQEKLAARLQAMKNAEKSKNVIQAGNLRSQWGQVVTNEQRLIDNGHYMKSAERATLDFMREQYRKAKKAQKNEGTTFRHVKKRDGKTVSVVEKFKEN